MQSFYQFVFIWFSNVNYGRHIMSANNNFGLFFGSNWNDLVGHTLSPTILFHITLFQPFLSILFNSYGLFVRMSRLLEWCKCCQVEFCHLCSSCGIRAHDLCQHHISPFAFAICQISRVWFALSTLHFFVQHFNFATLCVFCTLLAHHSDWLSFTDAAHSCRNSLFSLSLLFLSNFANLLY